MDNNERILQQLEENELDSNMKFIAEVIGFENAKKLILYCGGDMYYIPTVGKYKSMLLEKYLKNTNISVSAQSRGQLVRLYGLSRKTVNDTINKIKSDIGIKANRLNF